MRGAAFPAPARAAVLVPALLAALVGTAGVGGCTSAVPVGQPARPASPASAPLPPPPAVLAAPLADAPLPSTAGLARALAPALRDPGLGPRIAAVVVDMATGQTLLDRSGAIPVPPASTAKLVTAVAALTVLGPDASLVTRVVRPAPDLVVLVGGGDPTLASPQARTGYPAPARLAPLAAAAALAVGPGVRVRVGYDASRWSGPATAPGWRPSYVTRGNIAPVAALSVDAGRARPDRDARVADPARAAARRFATLLANAGVRVVGAPGPKRALGDAAEIARASSPPVAVLVQQMLATSDNDVAEALGREVALRLGEPPTFAGTARALQRALEQAGAPTAGLVLADASGLSRRDRLPPRLLAVLLALAASPDHPALRPVLSGLPVAGFSGTLATRFVGPRARGAAGVVRAKTGSLAGVSSLAGATVDRDGRPLAFALVADAVPPARAGPAAAALDRAAAVVAACGCR